MACAPDRDPDRPGLAAQTGRPVADFPSHLYAPPSTPQASVLCEDWDERGGHRRHLDALSVVADPAVAHPDDPVAGLTDL